MRTIVMMCTVAATALASAAACAPGGVASSPVDPGEPAPGDHVSVSVENQRPVAMRIFATRENMRFLVGEVGPRETARFRIPPMILSGRGSLRLVADPRASTMAQESDPVVLTDGREVQWRLRKGGGDWLRVR